MVRFNTLKIKEVRYGHKRHRFIETKIQRVSNGDSDILILNIIKGRLVGDQRKYASEKSLNIPVNEKILNEFIANIKDCIVASKSL